MARRQNTCPWKKGGGTRSIHFPGQVSRKSYRCSSDTRSRNLISRNLKSPADGFPFSGKLEIKFQDTTNLGNVTNHVTNVVVTHIVSGGIDVEATLVEAASENHGEVKIAFGDTPFTENADLLFNNVLHVKNGGFTSEWMIGEKTDSFLVHAVEINV